MAQVTYEVVEHNGGFAYRVGDVFSETFATHAGAHQAAAEAAERQQLSGTDALIQYQDADGKWHEEVASGDRRPETAVTDDLPEDLEARAPDGRKFEEGELPDPDRAPIDVAHRQQ